MTQHWFISPQHQPRSRLVLLAVLLAFVVILLGAYTRLTDAGLSCPDWPHCYGYLTAPHTPSQLQNAARQYPFAPVNVKKAWTEMTHRYVAGTEGIIILFLSAALLFHKAKSTRSTIVAMSLLALLLLQVTLGMLTVTEKLKPIIVLSHLLTGLSILGILWWAYLDLPLKNHPFPVPSSSPPAAICLWLGLIIISLQITLGGWVSTHYAGLACVDFPYCNGSLLPNMQWNKMNSDLVTIHMLHRIGALATALYVIALGLFLFTRPAFRLAGIVLLTLVCLQVTLGILNIIWLRPIWIALVHQAVAILLLLTIITILIKAARTRENRYA